MLPPLPALAFPTPLTTTPNTPVMSSSYAGASSEARRVLIAFATSSHRRAMARPTVNFENNTARSSTRRPALRKVTCNTEKDVHNCEFIG